MKYSRLILFFVLLFFASDALSQIYEWVDENGVKRYSNQPPPENAQVINKYDEIVTENEDKSSSAEQNKEQKDSEANADIQKPTAPQQEDNKQKDVESAPDTQESETIRKLKEALNKNVTSRKRRKLLRQLKAAEAREIGAKNGDK